MLFVALRYDKPPEHTVFTEKLLRVNIVPTACSTDEQHITFLNAG